MARRRGEEAVAFWRGLIERQAASGLAIWRFCDRAGVSTASFHAWKRKLASGPQGAGLGRGAGSACAFVPVRVIADAGPAAIAVELPGGIVLRIPANGDAAMIRAAAQLAGELARGVTSPC
jgi:hypothetical protein